MLNKCSRNGQQVLRTSDEPLKRNVMIEIEKKINELASSVYNLSQHHTFENRPRHHI